MFFRWSEGSVAQLKKLELTELGFNALGGYFTILFFNLNAYPAAF
jgi:hypothetical protein